MEAYKAKHLKSKKEVLRRTSVKQLILNWMISIEKLQDSLFLSMKRMSMAIWALVIYNVIFTGLFLLMIYGNQYLVK